MSDEHKPDIDRERAQRIYGEGQALRRDLEFAEGVTEAIAVVVGKRDRLIERQILPETIFSGA
jgi:hypothetical protein